MGSVQSCGVGGGEAMWTDLHLSNERSTGPLAVKVPLFLVKRGKKKNLCFRHLLPALLTDDLVLQWDKMLSSGSWYLSIYLSIYPTLPYPTIPYPTLSPTRVSSLCLGPVRWMHLSRLSTLPALLRPVWCIILCVRWAPRWRSESRCFHSAHSPRGYSSREGRRRGSSQTRAGDVTHVGTLRGPRGCTRQSCQSNTLPTAASAFRPESWKPGLKMCKVDLQWMLKQKAG